MVYCFINPYIDDDRWEEEEQDEEDYEEEDYDSDENPLPAASKYPPSKVQREEDEKFKTWLSQAQSSTM